MVNGHDDGRLPIAALSDNRIRLLLPLAVNLCPFYLRLVFRYTNPPSDLNLSTNLDKFFLTLCQYEETR